MVSLMTEEARIRPCMDSGWHAGQAAVLVGRFLVVQSSMLRGRQQKNTFLLRRLPQSSFLPGAQLPLSGLAMRFFVEKRGKCQQETLEFLGSKSCQGFHETRFFQDALDLHRQWERWSL